MRKDYVFTEFEHDRMRIDLGVLIMECERGERGEKINSAFALDIAKKVYNELTRDKNCEEAGKNK